jgi:hypothetical protein
MIWLRLCRAVPFVVSTLSDDERNGRRGKVDDADVSIQIECALDLRKVSFTHERLLVRQKARHNGYATEVQRGKIGKSRQRDHSHDCDYVHRT